MDFLVTKIATLSRQLAVLWGIWIALLPSAYASNSWLTAELSSAIFDLPTTGVIIPQSTVRPWIYSSPTPPDVFYRTSANIVGPQTIYYDPGQNFVSWYVQDDLQVGYQYTYRFSVDLKAFSSDGRFERQVPDGWYLLTIAVMKKDTSYMYGRETTLYDRFVTAADPIIVNISNGKITGREVSLKFDSIDDTAIENTLYLELAPLYENCGYSDQTGHTYSKPCITLDSRNQPDVAHSDLRFQTAVQPFIADMDFLAFKRSDRATVDPTKYMREGNPFLNQPNLASFVTIARKQKEDTRRRLRATALNSAQYAQLLKLNYLYLTDPIIQKAEAAMPDAINFRSTIQSLLDTKALGTIKLNDSVRNILPGFCALLQELNGEQRESYLSRFMSNFTMVRSWNVTNCKEGDPDSIFTIKRIVHVGNINRRGEGPTIIRADTMPFTVTKNFVVSRSHSGGSYWNVTLRPYPTVSRFNEKVLQVGVPIDSTQPTNSGTDRSRVEIMSTSTADNLNFDVLALNIPTVQSQACLEVRILAKAGSSYYDSRPNALNGLYICDTVKRNMDVQEIYGHMFTRSPDSPLAPGFHPVKSNVNLTFRGDQFLSYVYYSLRDSLKPEHDAETMPSQLMEKAVQNTYKKPFQFSNMVVTSVHFMKEPYPSLAETRFNQEAEPFSEDHAPDDPSHESHNSFLNLWNYKPPRN